MKKTFLFIALFAVSFNSFAQVADSTQAFVSSTEKQNNNPGYDPKTEFFEIDPSTRVIAKWGVTAFVPIVTLGFGRKAWAWGSGHKPYARDERWFQQDTSFGGADKAGHMYAHYVTERFLFTVFDHLDSNPTEKVIFSTGLTCVVGLMIEIGDAYTSQYGFAINDIIADYTGVALGAVLDSFPTADAFVGMTVNYKPTDAFRENEKGVMRALEWVNDYSGFIYMINFKLAGFKYIGMDIPEFMRYIQIDAGYYTRHMSAYDEKKFRSKDDNRRYLYAGVSVNFAEVVKDFYDDDNSAACRLSQVPFRYYTINTGPSLSHGLSH